MTDPDRTSGFRYRVANLLPVGSVFHDYIFTKSGNAEIVRNTSLPIPVIDDWNVNKPIGSCSELHQEDDGTVSAVVSGFEIPDGYRLGVGISGTPSYSEDTTPPVFTFVEAYLAELSLTDTPDPCGDVQTITRLEEE